MTYYIIGGDQQEYGPVPAATLRQWIADGRANAQTQARAEGEAAWRPLGTIPEFASLLGAGLPPPLPPGASPATAVCSECGKTFATGDLVRHGQYFVCAACKPVFMQKLAEGAVLAPAATPVPPPTVEEILAQGYHLDIGRCFERAWAVFKANLWPCVGISLLVFIAFGVLSNVSVLLLSGTRALDMEAITKGDLDEIRKMLTPTPGMMIAGIINGALQSVFFGGLYYYYLRLLRGAPGELSDAFTGFSRFFPVLAGVGLLEALLGTISSRLCYLPMVYFWVALCFTQLLVVDRGLGVLDALKVSLKVANKRWFLLLGLCLLVMLTMLGGVLGCCVGVIFTYPLGILVMAAAYLQVFDPQYSAAPVAQFR